MEQLSTIEDERGVDISQIRRQLRMSVEERVRHMVDVTNTLMEIRASARFVRTAECFDAEVKVTREGTTVSGGSIMGLMMLGAGPGSTILVQATGKQAREALDAITTLVENGFDEDNEGAGAES